jgi:hypothetical protein
VDEIVRKIKPEGLRKEDLEGMSAEFTVHANAHGAGGSMKKTAEVWGTLGATESSRWVLTCDEGAAVGGDDSAPAPLIYFGAAAAF